MYSPKPTVATGHAPQAGKRSTELTIENMDELLFDDLLWLAQAQREHDNFAEILRKDGTEVLYFSDCLADVVDAAPIREQLIKDVFKFECLDRRLSEAFITELMNIPSKELADHLIEGYTKRGRDICKCNLSLVSSVENGSDFIIHPIPNLYFQRSITVANGT
ncbi:MAG: arginine deiminase family protein [Cloacibacillus evryensis]